jgi:class 3 adenylate cyclase
LDLLFHLFPRHSLGLDAVSPVHAGVALAWLAVAIGAAMALRRGWYSDAARVALGVLDPVIILTLFLLIQVEFQGTAKASHPIVVTAVACALLAATGALRLTTAACALSTAAALVVFGVVAVSAHYTVVEALFVCGLIVATGMLGRRLAKNTRRAVESEGSRVILRRFLPRHLADSDSHEVLRMVATPRVVEATVLVSDLRGFTAMAERMTPEETLAILNQVQARMASCVRAHGGVIDKFMGDGLLAVFGAMEPLPGHAGAAIRAATAMRVALAEVSASRPPPPLRIGIGVHSGTLVTGCLGSGERLEFTVIGDTVNTAARLEGATKRLDVDVLVSAASAAMAKRDGTLIPPLVSLGEVALRGREEPVAVLGLAAEGATAPEDQVAPAMPASLHDSGPA